MSVDPCASAASAAETEINTPTRTFRIIDLPTFTRSFELDQQRSLLDRRPRTSDHRLHLASGRGAQLVLHLHRLHHDERLPRLYCLADLHVHSNDEPRHRRLERRRPRWRRGLSGEISNRARALVERFDVEAIAVEPQRIDSAARTGTND